jgi:dihydrofolate synthase/folylpolyglutamate synthase
VITNIGIDHTEFLGNTLAQIAEEKAGIMKPHVPCVVGETQSETQEVFLSRARVCDILGEGLETTDCRLWFADQCGYMRKRRLKEAPECQLQGVYQDKNQQTAYVALQVLRNYCGVELSKEAIATGFAHVCTLTGLRGRWEVLSQNPLTICDTGHNGHGIRYVAEQLNSLISSPLQGGVRGATLHIILGMVNDKDIDTVLALLPTEAVYYFTQPATSRALPAEELLRRWQQFHPIANRQYPISAYPTVREALEAAKEAATAEDIIFIGGSNYVVGEALSVRL